MRNNQLAHLLPAISVACALGGCAQQTYTAGSATLAPVPASLSGDPQAAADLDAARADFARGYFGNAEKRYRSAIEASPRNADAWLGLGATYDRLRRFDLANKAYTMAIELIGYTAPVLNNLGYHYYLRGEYGSAEKALLAAQRKDPGSPHIANNIRLLRAADGRGR